MEIKTVGELVKYLQDNFDTTALIHNLEEDNNNPGEIIERKIFSHQFIKNDANDLHIDLQGLV